MSERGLEGMFYERVMRQAPGVDFLWPSRGRDLRLARSGHLPPNARPFAVDHTVSISELAADCLGREADFAVPLFASLMACQGRHFDAVEIPSTIPIAHLVRPASAAFAVTVGAVVQNWLGRASDLARNTWPDPAAPLETRRLAKLETASDSAVELRFGIAGTCPPCANGAPVMALAGEAVIEPGDAEASHPASAFLVAPALPHAFLGAFLQLYAALPEPLRRRVRLPPGLPDDLRHALAADPVGRSLAPLMPGEAAVIVDCSPVPVFNPAPLDALRRGDRVVLGKGCWSAAVLDHVRPAHAPHGIDLHGPGGIDRFAAALADPIGIDISDRDFGGVSLSSIYLEAQSLPIRAGERSMVVSLSNAARHDLETSFPTVRRCAEPRVSFVLPADGDGALRGVAATLASLGRLTDLPREVIVVANETVSDIRRLENLVRAAGSYARILHIGRHAGLLPVIQAATAPLVAFLMPGDRLDSRFGPWAVGVLEAQALAAAAPPWASVAHAKPGTTRSAPVTSPPCPGPATVFRRDVLATLGGVLGPTGIREAMQRIARLHGRDAIRITVDGPALALAENPSIYEARGTQPHLEFAERARNG